MKVFKVEGTLVATARIGNLDRHRLLVVQERGTSSKQVAVDPVGCKPGDWVIAVGSSAARDAAGSKEYPSDLTIVGIIVIDCGRGSPKTIWPVPSGSDT